MLYKISLHATMVAMAQLPPLPRGRTLSVRLRRAPTRYQPTSRLAVGGMAEVWRAEAVFENGERVPIAIKRVLPELAQNKVYVSMFEDEARLGMMMRHSNIVRVFDARHIQSTFLMIMELVEGTSLKDLIDQAHARNAKMPLAPALLILRDLLRALDYAHNAVQPDSGIALGIIHRDVSPHNLLLSDKGYVKLADFGLADASVHKTSLGEGMLGGKLAYLAPEVIAQQPVTHSVDLFAAGVVFWELVAGRKLFLRGDDASTVRAVAALEVPDIRSLNPRVTDYVADEVLAGLLERDPASRFATAADALAAVDYALAQVDAHVSVADVALLVKMHLANNNTKAIQPQQTFSLLSDELEAFVAQTSRGFTEIGAAPLDPNAFG